MKDVFEEIYRINGWGQGSGEGSLPANTRPYVRFLQKFLRGQQIRSVVDLGCGDWQFSHLIDWDGIAYGGYDLVSSVIDANRRKYARDNVAFHLFDGDFDRLPAGDLLIAKDVLQHWSIANINRLRPALSRFRFSLITNCVNPDGPTANQDIGDGAFRPLDLRRPPFAWPLTEVFAFSEPRPWWKRLVSRPRWQKNVLLGRADMFS